MDDKQQKFLAGVLSLSLFFFLAGVVWSQGDLDLSWWTIDTGGDHDLTIGDYTLSDTIGQADASSLLVSQSTQYTLGSGFLAGAGSVSAYTPIFLEAESGYVDIELIWNSTNDPNVTSYHISRAISGTVNYVPIGTTSSLFYFDNDASLVPNTTYCYQVEALHSDLTVILQSNTSCATLGQIELWTPEIGAGTGETAIVPIHIKNANGLSIAAGEIWLEYNSNVISPTSVANTPLTSGYTWDYNIVGSGSNAQIQIFTNESNPPALYGDGPLAWLYVEVIGTDGEFTALNLLEFVDDIGGTSIYSPDNLTTPIPLILTDGTFHAGDCTPYRLGDLNGNCLVEAVDGYIALGISSGLISPTPEQETSGDINGNGSVNAADASMIYFYAVNGYWPSLQLKSTLEAKITSVITVGLEEIESPVGVTVPITLNLTTISDWAGSEFVIAYDPVFITSITDFTLSGIAAGFNVSVNEENLGQLHIAIAQDSPVAGSGVIATMQVHVSPNAPVGQTSTIALASAQFNDVNGYDFATSVIQQQVIRENGYLYILGDESIHLYLPLIVK